MIYAYSRKLNTSISLLIALTITSVSSAQSWINKKDNFYTIYNNYLNSNQHIISDIIANQNKSLKERKALKKDCKLQHESFEHFYRWANHVLPRIYPSGNLSELNKTYQALQKINASKATLKTTTGNSWQPLGPSESVLTMGTSGNGSGRLSGITFMPGNTQTIFASAPAGGIWKTTNAGNSWTTNTDEYAVIGFSDVAIHPTNSNIMYAATGDRDASDTYSIGLLKTTDGGATWNPTGLTFNLTWLINISRVIVNSANPNTIIVASDNGVYRSNDAGITFTKIINDRIKDLDVDPQDPNTLYASGQNVFKSTDGGATFTLLSNGIPDASLVSRIALAIAPSDPQRIYLLVGNTNNGLEGFYISNDGGTSFVNSSTSVNLLGWDVAGNDINDGGQAWYDLAIAVSPLDKDHVFTGGVNIWETKDGGNSWTIATHWAGDNGVQHVHADIHDLTFTANNYLYACTDGGVYQTTDLMNWNSISSNMQIAQIYKAGISQRSNNYLVTGHQDNGSKLLSGNQWKSLWGGDGMDNLIDYKDDSVSIVSVYYGAFASVYGQNGWVSDIPSTSHETGAWVTPILQDPKVPKNIYAGYSNLHILNLQDLTTGFYALTNFTDDDKIRSIAVSEADNNIIYFTRGAGLSHKKYNGAQYIYRFEQSNSNLLDITGNLPTWQAYLTDVKVSDVNPNHLWITFGGYADGEKIYESKDGGTTWTNISTGLPNIPVNCIVHQKNSKNLLYVGTDVGVYVKDSTMNTWVMYSTDLPNVIVNDLEINYIGAGKIYAATYGRAMWSCDLYTPFTPIKPKTIFTASKTKVCPGENVSFYDNSLYNPTNWKWTFPGGGYPTGTGNPGNTFYDTPGNYEVKLVVSNAAGSDSVNYTSFIEVEQSKTLPIVDNYESGFLASGWESSSPGYAWNVVSPSANGVGVFSVSSYYYNYETAGDLTSPLLNFTNLNNINLSFDVASAFLTDSVFQDSLDILMSTDCGNSYQSIYRNGGLSLSTASVPSYSEFVPTDNQWKKITVNLNSAIGIESARIAFRPLIKNGMGIYLDNINITSTTGINTISNGENITLAPNPNNGQFTLTVSANSAANYTADIIDVDGRLVYSKKINTNGITPTQQTIDIYTLSKGMYFVQLKTENGLLVKSQKIIRN